jgi:hypothetical protein
MRAASFGLRSRARDAARDDVRTALRTHRPLNRAQLAPLLGLPKSTSRLVVAELLASGSLVKRSAPAGFVGPWLAGRLRFLPAGLGSICARIACASRRAHGVDSDPMAVDSDANYGALGALEFGLGSGKREFVYQSTQTITRGAVEELGHPMTATPPTALGISSLRRAS